MSAKPRMPPRPTKRSTVADIDRNIDEQLELQRQNHLNLFAAGFLIVSAFILLILCFTQSFASTELVYVTQTVPSVVFSSLGEFNIIFLVIVFQVVAFIRLVYCSTIGYERYSTSLKDQSSTTNKDRWTEYYITYSAMTIVVCLVNGILNIAELFALFTLSLISVAELSISETETTTSERYASFLVGVVSFGVKWLIILTQFAYNASISSANAEWFVYTIDIGMFLFEIAIGLVHFYRMKGMYNAKQAELRFLALEFFSKMFLAWITFGGFVIV